MKIHFVCTGNTFRSRLAEAYLKSKNIDNLETTSSGIEAEKNIVGTITWYAKRIIKNNNLVPLKSLGSWTQTTGELLSNQDLIIFMQKWHYQQSVEKFGFNGKNFEIWDIEDVSTPFLKNNPEAIKFTESAYEKIKNETDNLIARNFKPKNL